MNKSIWYLVGSLPIMCLIMTVIAYYHHPDRVERFLQFLWLIAMELVYSYAFIKLLQLCIK